MGIPKYHKWLTERYPDAFAEAQEDSSDHVYVDVNALLHDCMRHATSEDGFFQQLFRKFDVLFATVSPARSAFLAVDGPASCAKCLTQRTRRRTHAQKDAKNKGKGKKGKGGGKGTQGEALSNNMLTPGVPFMARLTSAIEYYAASRMRPGGVFERCTSVTVSGAQSIGEGEHKIVSQMLRNAASPAEAGIDESHVIFSGDADIFLLSLVQSACRMVRVVSERQATNDDMYSNKRKRGMMLQVWNAEVLAGYIHRELTGGPSALSGTAAEADLRRDFALVSLLAGNDYLPELKCALKPQQLWERYLALRRKEFPHECLVSSSPAEDGLPLSHLEGGWALTVGETGAAFAAEPYEHFAFNAPLLLQLMLAASGGQGASSQDMLEKAANGAKKYLEGLLWILEMYHHGYCADFFFVLEKAKHTYASASLIVQFLRSTYHSEALAPQRSEAPPMRPLSCGLCILPVHHAEQFLCRAAPALRPMFAADHPLLGSVNRIERCEDLKDCKQKSAALQAQLMKCRERGEDDSRVKAELTANQQRMEGLKQGCSDIDVVPLQEVDAEVVARCEGASPAVPSLNFAPDVTLARGEGGGAFRLAAPAAGMAACSCVGLLYVTGEWPPASSEAVSEALSEAAGCDGPAAEEEGQQDEATPGRGEESAVAVGASAEGYWPDDATWLPVVVSKIYADGSYQILWGDASAQSDVPADYVRPLRSEEPPLKRARQAGRIA